ncbi:hypothetical protein DM813_04195 [Pseudomonas alkylphenolica]|uniref:Uncharacterized protein n=1 Tax=Pseudomonas alkylphenolica TaxID=237609 RepID=A0A443ZVZ2_9PSED|nr:site-specific integrase [Pseudomonas alkylphenolica]RWU24953.1 hypothetical protein DM813_04195 [Pseudomonas alkylphenolica]
MRVPITLADLRAKYGFNRISKKLQRNWPGTVSVSLASSQDILSRGLGYRDLHDLQNSTDKQLQSGSRPSQDEVRDWISTSIITFCQSKKVIDIGNPDVARLVALLPLHELTAFQTSRAQQRGTLLPMSLVEVLMSPTQDLDGASGEEQLGDASVLHEELNAELMRQPADAINEEDLQSFWEVVQRKGSLRDQCFCLGLLEGLRLNDLLGIKVGDVSLTLDSVVSLHIEITKSKPRKARLRMPPSFGKLVGEYIRQTGLSHSDYLFPSTNNASISMPPETMRRVVDAYLLEAMPEKTKRRVSLIRQAARDRVSENLSERLYQWMGHTNINSTLAYLSLSHLPSRK